MLKTVPGVKSLFLTTNGVQASNHLDSLLSAGVDGINLSLDTLDRKRYHETTRRDCLDEVLRTFHGAIALNIPVKVNSVVLEDTDDDELLSLIGLSKKHPVTVRFIEKMPFSGAEKVDRSGSGNLLDRLRALLPDMEEVNTPQSSTARVYSLPGHQGKIGVIEGNSRHFCGSCNKVRITPTGMLKTCLYDNGVLDLRALLRSGCDDNEIGKQIKCCVQNSAADGHAAERISSRLSEPSMSRIGG